MEDSAVSGLGGVLFRSQFGNTRHWRIQSIFRSKPVKCLSIPVITLACALTLAPPALASHGNVAAPAPLIGANLPGLAIGFGVFWLIRHRARPRKID
jgi:hypothetical protein